MSPVSRTERVDRLLADLLRSGFQLWSDGGGIAYRGPAERLTPEIRASLAELRPEVLDRLRGARYAPVTAGQEQLVFLDRLGAGDAYNVPLAWSLRGSLRAAALATALDEAARRHEALRTRLPALAGQPVQRIEPPRPSALGVADLSGLAEADRERAAESCAAGAGERRFDLARGPLVRSRLLRLAADRHRLLVTLHHAIFDGASLPIVTAELSAGYASALAGRPVTAPEPEGSYADFAARQLAEAREEARELELWRERLAGLAPLSLPTDRPASTGAGHRSFGRHRIRLSSEVLGELRRLARRTGTSLPAALVAATVALLARLSGEEDLAVAMPASLREGDGDERVVGYFVNTLVLRFDLSGDPTVGELLGQARDVLLEAFEHRRVPLARVVETLAATTGDGRGPVPVLCSYEPPEADSPRLPGVAVERRPVPVVPGKLDLSIVFRESEDSLEVETTFDRGRIDDATVRRWSGYLERILVGFEPGHRLSGVPMLSGGERTQLLHEWAGAREVDGEGDLAAALAAAWHRDPEAPAVLWAGGGWSRRQLEERSAALAGALVERGARTGDLVGLELAASSPHRIAGFLAALRGGFVALPLSPDDPPARRDAVLGRTGCRWLVTRGADPPPAGVTVLDPEERGEAELPLSGDPRALAYVIHTSGSSGEPKGVAVEQRAILVHLRSVVRAYGLGPDDRFLYWLAPSFDPAVEGLLAPLLVGGAVVLPEDHPVSGAALVERVEELGATVVDLPTGYFRLVAGELPAGLPGVRLLLVGGDELPVDAVERWRTWRDRPRLVNVYGPAEAVVTATTHELPERRPASGERLRVSIGRPLPGHRAHVVDSRGRAAPAGVAGEILLGGEALARGYLGRPAATACSFGPDPWSGRPGARLYRTGDLGRWLPGGRLEFLGRADDQAKVRGFRVEPAEVEAVLLAFPEVVRAVVVVRGAVGERRLVAYVVAESSLERGRLEAFCRTRLPDYMVPDRFVELPELPLSAHGKVDRAALPEPAAEAAGSAAEPRGPLEELAAEIWCDLLGLEAVVREDSFFALGGHSLLALEMVSRLGERVGVELPLALVFSAPRLEDLCREVEATLLREIESMSDEEAETALGAVES